MAPASRDDWFDIQALFIRYATSLDSCDVAAVLDCFEPDGTLESPVLGKFVGHAGIRDFANRTVKLKAEGVQFRHVVSNLRAEVDGDRGRAWCYLLDFMTQGGKTELLSPGEYDCDLKKRAGVWRFTRRDVAMDRLFVLPDAVVGQR